MRKRFVFFFLLIVSMSMGVHAQNSGRVTIVDRTPAADAANVDGSTALTVVFSQPVVPLTGSAEAKSLPAPVILSPDIPGTGEWVHTVIWQFTPDDPFPINTTITVRTDDAFVAVDGSSLAADQWQFTTGLSRALYVSVGLEGAWRSSEYAVEPDWSLALRFGQAFDKESAEKLIELHDAKGESVPVTFEWKNSVEVVVDPVEPLAIGAEYTLVAADTLDGHQLLEEPFSQIIHTIPLPSVARVSPEPDSQAGLAQSRRASIQFATNMNLNSLRGLIQVEPETIEWEVQTRERDFTNVYINLEPALGQTVTITLLAGAEDPYGNKIESDYRWSFEVAERLPSLESYLALRDTFVVTNAYRDNTRLAMVTRGAEDFTSNLALYRAGDIAAAMQTIPADSDQYTSLGTFSSRLLENADLLRSWQQTFNGGGSRKASEILLAGEEGGQLEPGLYLLLADEYRAYGDPHVVTQQMILAVSTVVLTVRRAPTEMLVWVADMKTGSPVANASVTLYSRDGTTANATTDQNGIARVPDTAPATTLYDCYYPDYCQGNDYAIITAQAPGVYGAWHSDLAFSPQTTIGNLYTDRRVYRPGDPVYFRGVLRDKDDMTYTVPTMNTVEVSLCGSYDCEQSGNLQTITVPVSYWGTINGSFTLPADVEPGLYRIVTGWGHNAFSESYCYSYYDFGELYCDPMPSDGTQITVATFDTPEFEMSAAPVAAEGRQGEPLGVAVNANLYSGSPLRGATVDWEVRANEGAFRYEDYQFTDRTLKNTSYDASSGSEKDIPPITTDADGTAIIPTESIVANVPLYVNMDVMVSEGAERHATSVSFFLHSASVYVGLHRQAEVVEQGDAIAIDVVTVSPDHQTVANQTITYTIEHLRPVQYDTEQYGYYYWETVVTPVSSGTLTTGADGTTTITFPADETGKYRLRAVTTDEQGHSHSSSTEVRVGAEPQIPFQAPTYEDKRFTITNDQAVYQPSDSAHLTIQPPGQGTLLLTVQRQNVQRAFVLAVESDEPLVFELPLGYEDAPNIYVEGTFVQGMLSADDSPSYATATSTLYVHPAHRMLNVEVTASASEVSPGDSVTFDVQVTDQRGIPVRAEIGMALVDDAILSLAPSASPSLADTFYSGQPNRVYSSISLRGLVDDLTDKLGPPGMGGGGGGGDASFGASIDPRQNFITTPLWLPSVVTDENGHASATVTLPDNLTRWRLDVRAVSLTTLVGQGGLEVASALPFFVRPQTPRFVVAGDIVELAMIAHNETSAAQTVTASIQAEGVTLLEDAEKNVTLPPGSQQRIAWRAQVDNVESVDVTFFAGNDVVQDAARPDLPDNRIPVLKYLAPDTVATAGILDEAETRTEVIRPPAHALESELSVSLASSLVDTAAAALESYPPDDYETIDRVIARLMINVALFRAGGHDSLAEAIEWDIQQLDKLRITTNYIGWEWTAPKDYYWDVVTTGYSVIALTEASDAGFESADAVRAPACGYMSNGVYSLPQTSDSDAVFNRAAFAHFIEALCGRVFPNTDLVDNLFANRERLSPAAKGFLLLSIPADNQEMRQTLVDDLLGSSVTTATGLHWPGRSQSLWDTDTLTTAVVLRALIITTPEKALLPNIVRWLTLARSGDRWSTPLETGWSVTTLVDYALTVEGQAAPSYSLDVQLDSEAVLNSVPAVGLHEQLALPLDQDEHTLALERSAGNGLLYYTAVLQASLPAAETTATARGITVIREYLDVNGEPVNSVAVGESVFVRLTVIASQDMYYFVLNDPLPGGLIADDPSLIETATSGISVTRVLSDRNPRWFYGSSAFSRSVYGNTSVQFYASTLPRGTYVVTYEARAGAAGDFQAMPTHAYSAVMPDIFGRGAGQIFTIAAPSKPD